ncbi:MAG: peptidase M29 [Alphaproteobacteria bacterium]|nr:peptidase M29 [Alphaproteobacteria bacterium]
MMQQRAEEKWVTCFEQVFEMSGVGAGDLVGILSESLSRPVLVELADRGLQRRGARVFHIQVPTPSLTEPVPVRSTGSTTAFEGYDDLLSGLGNCSLVVDCTVEGLLHAKERDVLLQAGTRVFMISNEHPEILERCMPDQALQPRVDLALSTLSSAREMRVTSSAGTDLVVNVTDAPTRGGAGFLGPDDKVAYWPAGLCLCFPLQNSVNGTVVLDVGDVNLTFKRYVESPVTFRIENDYVTAIEGTGLDAELLRSYYAGWNDPLAYTVSHVGWGLNPGARWDALVMYDKDQTNGTELRALEGSFLFSTGANDFAVRYTACHFDYPMRNCDVSLDGVAVVEKGRLVS